MKRCPLENGGFWNEDSPLEIRRLEGRQNITYAMVSINCGILASGMGGSGDRERKWEGKFHQQGLKLKLKIDQNDLELTKKGWKQCFVPKKTFLFVEHTLPEEIILNSGRKPHNQFCPNYNHNISDWKQTIKTSKLFTCSLGSSLKYF